MNLSFLRYFGIALIAGVFGVGGGYLAVNNKSTMPVPPSGTTVAVPAQPFPGRGIPAIPAVPAQPQKGKPDIGKSIILFIQGEAGKNQVVNPMLITTLPSSGYISDAFASVYSGGAIKNVIVGANFSPKNNTVYWDGAVLARDMEARENSDGNQNIYLPVPANTELGSFHAVYVKSPYGISNTIKVQAVEHHDLPWFWGIRPDSGPVGTKGEAKIWESMDYGFWPSLRPDAPLSSKMYLGFRIPGDQIKSGAEGFAYIFIPSALERSSADPSHYGFSVPSEAIYCPSWGWEASECALAPANTMVPFKAGQYYSLYLPFFVFEYKYRGVVKGFSGSGDIPWVSDPVQWFYSFTVTK